MTDQLIIEAGIDAYLLEDGTGVLLVDQRVEVKNSTVGVTEARNRIGGILKHIADTIGLIEVSQKIAGIFKVATLDTIGLSEVTNKLDSEYEFILEDGLGHYELEGVGETGDYLQDYPLKVANSIVGVVETSQKTPGILKWISETIGFTDVENHIFGFVKVVTSAIAGIETVLNKILTEVNFYGLEDGTGRYENEDGVGSYLLDQLALLKYATSTIGLTETSQRLLGPVKNILDTVNVVEGIIRAKVMVRNLSSIVGVIENSNRLGGLIRNFTTTVGITEASNRLGVIIRNFSTTIGITEASQRLKGLTRTITSTVGITEVSILITGIVKAISDIVGLTDSVNKIRIIFISNDMGTFTVKDVEDYDNFITMASLSMDNFVVIDSYNLNGMIIIDDD